MRTPAPLCHQLARLGDLPYRTIKHIITFFQENFNPLQRVILHTKIQKGLNNDRPSKRRCHC